MRPRSGRRVLVIQVLVTSLVLTLLGRLFFVQMLDRHKPVQTAGDLHNGRIVIPAPRGEIVDSRGRVLVTNRATYVVTVNRAVLLAEPDKGAAVLLRLAKLLDTTAADVAQEITPCGITVPSPCWIGEPYQPVPVATDASDAVLLAIKEHQEDYPGVAIETQTLRTYPDGELAAHEVGYIGQVSAADKKTDSKLNDDDTIGQSGLESSYDSALRGQDGYQTIELDARGNAVGTGATVAAQAGDTLITSIDANVQKLAETALAQEIAAVRKTGKPATGGAVVVMDPTTGRIIAAASYPTYDPQLFVGGISVADYQKLVAPSADDPLVSRAIAGEYAPGSTFKLVSASSDVMHGLATTDGDYSCPSSLDVDGRIKTNFDSESLSGPVDLAVALQFSCDTFFYKFAVDEYYNDQALIAAGKKPNEYLQHMARAFGFASSANVDLPADEQAVGTIADRETRQADWDANKTEYCADARHGYPEITDKTMRAYLTLLASQNCTDGWRYRAGDNADLSIGQGETTVSPLQLAVAYSAMVNGGTVWNPTFGWAEVDPAGRVVKKITPTVKNKVPVTKAVLSFIQDALRFQDNHQVSGAIAFDGSPIKTLISAKTGTAEVQGKDDTSWMASWGPGATPKFVVVTMVEQAGTGRAAAAPLARAVWEGLLGVNGPPTLPGSTPATTLPKIAAAPSIAPAPTASTPTTSTRPSTPTSPTSPTKPTAPINPSGTDGITTPAPSTRRIR